MATASPIERAGWMCMSALCLLALTWPAVGVRADAPFVLDESMQGVPLGRHVDVLEDPQGRLTFSQARARAEAGEFVPHDSAAPNFGFSSSAHWLRLEVRNDSDSPRTWILEVDYPHLDYVTLYRPTPAGGYQALETGDRRPFSARDIEQRNFAFEMRAAPAATQSYFLRVQTTGSLALPLKAWTPRAFLGHQQSEWAALGMFYGILFIMAVYSTITYLLVRHAEFLRYGAFVVSLGFLQFTFAGHTFQLLLPDHPGLANRLLAASIALVVMSGVHFADNYLGRQVLHRSFLACKAVAAGLVLAGLLLPYRVVIALTVPAALAASAIGLLAAILRIRSGDRRGLLFIAGWTAFLTGAGATMLRAEGLLPVNFFTTWGMQIGAVVLLALLSTVLADRINAMRADLADLNRELSERVDALREALTRAEEATQRAEEATRIKDDFMATMSHEFRTPLNAIINIPQGLLDYFPSVETALCQRCHSQFELEDEDHVDADTHCPECDAQGALRLSRQRVYVGQPEHTASYLGKIERSGAHLLQIVNGILDFSKLEAGQFRLTPEIFDARQLVTDALDQIGDLAASQGVHIELDAPHQELRIEADPLRLRQVLINLISNATKFSEPGSAVHVRLRDAENAVAFSVEDHGIGIEPEKLETVFQSFEQVHKGNTRRYGGTGLGLSIARSLVEMHGGCMWAESEPGKGSTFHFEIPKRLSAPPPRSGASENGARALLQETHA